MGIMDLEPRHVSDCVLDTIETFLETCPSLNTVEAMSFQGRVTGENSTVRMMDVVLDGETYLVVVKRVGGPRR